MKNKDIRFLKNNGLLLTTAHSVEPTHAYSLFLLKRTIEAACKCIAEKQLALQIECGLEPGKSYPKDDERIIRFRKTEEELLEEDTPLTGIRTITYDVWICLQRENMAKKILDKECDLLSGKTEMLLNGIFWTDMEEKKTTE